MRSESDRGNPRRLGALGSLSDLELDSLVLLERLVAVALNLRIVDEHVRAVTIGGDEAEALLAVEPLHSSLRHTY